MGLVNVQVWDATGNKKQDVQMPDDAPMNRILAVLLEKMSFPQYAPDGQLLSYKFHHRASGKQLLDDQTLSQAGVKDGDVLRLQPEITAGAGIASDQTRMANQLRMTNARRRNSVIRHSSFVIRH
jgi:uncharacterized ubiquitin-like protein YukD